jgi:hypothetical protein
MHMQVHMRDFLEGGGPNGVPHAHALTRKGPINRSGDPDQGVHQLSAGGGIKLSYVVEVFSRYHQDMARVVLARIDEGECQGILVDDVPGARDPP